MARILVVDDEPIQLRVSAATLQKAGHAVMTTDDAHLAVSIAAREQPELIVLDLLMPGLTGFEITSQLGQDATTRDIPVLFVSSASSPEDRVRGLRSGGHDYLVKPFAADELVIRAERLLGPDRGDNCLSGRFGAYTVWDLLQHLEQSRLSGRLVAQSADGRAEIELDRGAVTRAHFSPWSGREAVLALLGQREGRFSFDSRGEDEAALDGAVAPLPLQDVMLEASWLLDELSVRRAELPEAFAPIRATGLAVGPWEDRYAGLPLDAVLERASRPEATSLEALRRARPAPQLRLDLTVALLAERGLIDAGVGQKRLPTGAFDVASLRVNSFLREEDEGTRDVMALALLQKRSLGSVHVLLLAEPGAWPAVLDQFRRVPVDERTRPWRLLGDSLAVKGSGTGVLRRPEGLVSVHVQPLPDSANPTIAVFPLCTAVALCLGGGSDRAAQAVIARLESSDREHRGLLLGPASEAERAVRLLRGTKRWRFHDQIPTTPPRWLTLFNPTTG
ncbi:MAG: response regulator [Vicinamibacteria bacterium]|nr:response regulator [Vicinamibacteria bacterium]